MVKISYAFTSLTLAQKHWMVLTTIQTVLSQLIYHFAVVHLVAIYIGIRIIRLQQSLLLVYVLYYREYIRTFLLP